LDATFILGSSERPQGGVLVAWGFTDEGERVLLAVMLGDARLLRGLKRSGAT
jgi:hypothetical protein